MLVKICRWLIVKLRTHSFYVRVRDFSNCCRATVEEATTLLPKYLPFLLLTFFFNAPLRDFVTGRIGIRLLKRFVLQRSNVFISKSTLARTLQHMKMNIHSTNIPQYRYSTVPGTGRQLNLKNRTPNSLQVLRSQG